MDYEKFKKEVFTILVDHEYVSGWEKPKEAFRLYNESYMHPNFNDVEDVSENDDVVYMQWETGGSSGGDCWGGDSREYYEHNTVTDFVVLELICEKLAPEIPFMAFNKIRRDNIIDGSYSDCQYYGNRTDYAIKLVKLEQLYQSLQPYLIE